MQKATEISEIAEVAKFLGFAEIAEMAEIAAKTKIVGKAYFIENSNFDNTAQIVEIANFTEIATLFCRNYRICGYCQDYGNCQVADFAVIA